MEKSRKFGFPVLSFPQIFIVCLFLILSDIFVVGEKESATPDSLSDVPSDDVSNKFMSSFFNRLDSDSSGVISTDELNVFVKQTGGDSLDQDDEIKSATNNVLTVFDSDKDAVINKLEFTKHFVKQGIFYFHHFIFTILFFVMNNILIFPT